MKPGPTTGVAYKDADEIRAILIASTYDLINSGHPVQSLTARLVTQSAELDKMYVNRFFKNLDELLYAVLEDIFTKRTPTFVISKDFSSEDVSMCWKLNDAGVKIYIDPSIIVGHEKSTIIRERTM